jgi:hypothetical protein
MRRSLAISIALHVAAFVLLWYLPDAPVPHTPPASQSMDVVLVPRRARTTPPTSVRPVAARPAGLPTGARDEPLSSAAPLKRQQDAAPSRTVKDTARLTPAPAPKRRKTPELVEATTLYTAHALASRLGKATLADLDLTDPQERIIQLCNYEAIEQVRQEHPKLRADFALAEARSAPTLSGLSVTAQGAAIQGGGRWYDLSFRCEVAPDLAGVASFAFALGDAISAPERERLDLPAEAPVD